MGKLYNNKVLKGEIIKVNIRNKKKPETIFSDLIFKITGEVPSFDDSFNARKKQMNQWGLLESWNNRKIILGWIIEEVEKRGYRISEGRALSLLRAAFKKMRQNRASRTKSGDIAHQMLM